MYIDKKRFVIVCCMFFIFFGIWNGLAGIVDATNSPILYRFDTISTMALTMPVNSGRSPYRVARVKNSAGGLKEGHILVSNFPKAGETAGTGTAIMDVAPDGSAAVFSLITKEQMPGSCPGGIGMTTSIAVLRHGWVIVGIMPRADALKTEQAGCLLVLDSSGKPVETFSGSLIAGPWDLTVYERGHEAKLFVTNVANAAGENGEQIVNQGTVVRIDLKTGPDSMPRIASMTLVASGLAQSAGAAEYAPGPTGLGLSPRCGSADEDLCPDDGEKRDQALYVVDSLTNRIAVIENALYRTNSAGPGSTLTANGSLNEPRGIFIAPNGHILTVNKKDGIITEITPQGEQIAKAESGQFRQTAWREQAGLLGL